MTKAEFFEAMKDLPNDTLIYVPSRDCIDCWQSACYIEVVSDGKDGTQPEIELSGD